MSRPVNRRLAGRLDEVARLLQEQGANPFRVEAWRRAAAVVRGLDQPIDQLLRAEGVAGLEGLPGIGPGLARAMHDLITTGRLPLLDRLRGESDPITILSSVLGVGPVTADRLYHDLGIGTLEDLEAAAHDGRLARLGRVRRKAPGRYSRRPGHPAGPGATGRADRINQRATGKRAAGRGRGIPGPGGPWSPAPDRAPPVQSHR